MESTTRRLLLLRRVIVCFSSFILGVGLVQNLLNKPPPSVLQWRQSLWNAASNDEGTDATSAWILGYGAPHGAPPGPSRTKLSPTHLRRYHLLSGDKHKLLPPSVEASMITRGSSDVIQDGDGAYYVRLPDGDAIPAEVQPSSAEDEESPAALPQQSAVNSQAGEVTSDSSKFDSVLFLIGGLEVSFLLLTPPARLVMSCARPC